MKTAYGGTHFFSYATPTGMVPAQRMIAIHSRGNENPSANRQVRCGRDAVIPLPGISESAGCVRARAGTGPARQKNHNDVLRLPAIAGRDFASKPASP